MTDETKNVKGLQFFDFMRPETVDEITYAACRCKEERTVHTPATSNHLFMIPVPKRGESLRTAVNSLFKPQKNRMDCPDCKSNIAFTKHSTLHDSKEGLVVALNRSEYIRGTAHKITRRVKLGDDIYGNNLSIPTRNGAIVTYELISTVEHIGQNAGKKIHLPFSNIYS